MTCRTLLLSVALLPGCYMATDGLTVPVTATVAGDALAWMDDGVHAGEWRVDSGWIGVSDVTLVPCDARTAARSRTWQEVLLPVAWAHSPDVPDALTPAQPVDLTDPGTKGLLAARPAPGRYCAVELTLGPLPGLAHDGVAPVVALDLQGPEDARQITWPGTVVAWAFFDGPITVEAGRTPPAVALTLRLDRWLTAAHQDMTDEALLEVVVHAIERGITVRTM